MQYLIVMDHDRFSRDLSQALAKINELKRKYRVDVLSVDEPIDLNTSDPQIFINRTLKYAMANLELLNIRKRLKSGIRNAMESGRFMQKAPFGYRNGQDISGKSTLVIKETEASIIRKIYQDYLAGLPMHLIYKTVKALGFPNKGNSAIRRILQNCVYAGLISIAPTLERQNTTYVRALHEPIITEEDFWLVQDRLAVSRNRVQPHQDFPLRGLLRCSCGGSMTAGWSKGKVKSYLYYRCIKHSGINLPGAVLHEKFERLLHHLIFRNDQLVYLGKTAIYKLKKALTINTKQLLEQKQLKRGVTSNIERLEERFIAGEISSDLFNKWQEKLQTAQEPIKRRVRRLIQDRQGRLRKMSELLAYLTSAWDVYEKASWEGKYMLINQIFSGRLQYVDGIFRSDELNPVFIHIKRELEEKQLLYFSGINQTKINHMEITRELNTSIPQEELDLLDVIATIIAEMIMNTRSTTNVENTGRVQTQHGN